MSKVRAAGMACWRNACGSDGMYYVNVFGAHPNVPIGIRRCLRHAAFELRGSIR